MCIIVYVDLYVYFVVCVFWFSFVAFSFSTFILLVGSFDLCKTIFHMTYIVLLETLNHAQSINNKNDLSTSLCSSDLSSCAYSSDS